MDQTLAAPENEKVRAKQGATASPDCGALIEILATAEAEKAHESVLNVLDTNYS